MEQDILKRDQNHVTVIGAVTDDANQEVRMLLVDPDTGRLLVSGTGGGGGSAIWGDITGLLSNQTDLQDALDSKQDVIPTGTIAQYFRGDLSLATFPTAVSEFTNDAGYISDITGLVSAGSNVTITGTGTSGDPYVINSSGGGGGGTVTSVSGTSNRITVANGTTTPVIDISAAYVGQASITTLGTIGTGVWQGTVISSQYGGTGVNNGGRTFTIAGNFAVAGGHALTFTTTGATNVTLPTTGTLITDAVTSLPSLATVGTITSGVWNGTDIAVADGGTGASTASGARTNLGLVIGTDVQAFSTALNQISALGDPGVDRIVFWDDSNSTYAYLTVGTGLNISGTTLTATGAVTSVDDDGNGTMIVTPTTGDVTIALNEANNFAFTGDNTFAGTSTFDDDASFTANVTFTNLPTSSDTVVSSNQLVTKAYVDVFLQGLEYKGSVTAKTTAALPACTYNNGASGVGATLTGNANGALAAQDGVTLTVNQLLLVNDQASSFQNGIYTLTQVGTGGTPFILTRTTNFDASADIVQGAFVSVLMGTLYGNTVWAMDSASNPTVGTDAITFSQLSAPTVYTASLGVQLVGNDFQADLDAAGALVLNGNSIAVQVDDSSIEIDTNALQVKALGITNAMLAGSIADTKLLTISTPGKVDGAALINLQDIDSGAGIVPVANLGTGTPTASTYLNGLGAWDDLSGIFVSAITSSDTSLTVSGTGTVDIVLDTNHANNWTAAQSFTDIFLPDNFNLSSGTTGGLWQIQNDGVFAVLSGAVILGSTTGSDVTFQSLDTTNSKVSLLATSNVTHRLAFMDGGNSNYLSFRAPTTLGATVEWILPDADAAGFWQSDGAGNLSIGALAVTSGGTGQTAVTTGDLLYGSATDTWSRLAGVATGNALISGGVATAPSWGKIGLTTHVSGILPIANGGTNLSALGSALQVLRVNAGGTDLEYATISGSGDVVGPASATDNAIARFDTTTGKLIQNSDITIADLFAASVTVQTSAGNQLLLKGGNAATATSNGANTIVQAGTGGGVSGTGGTLMLTGGDAGGGLLNSGGVTISGGATGVGTVGSIKVQHMNSSSFGVLFNLANIATANRTYTFPNASGTLAISASGNITLSSSGNITFTGVLPVANGGTGTTRTASTTHFNSTASSAAVTNTTTPTTIIGTGVGSLTLAANFFTAGKSIRITVTGTPFNTSVTPNITFTLVIGGTSYPIVCTPTASQTNGIVTYEAFVTCRTTGASGTFAVWERVQMAYAGLSTFVGATTAGTINTTVSNAVNVTATWANASASNSITGIQALIEVIN